ncbi:DoxX family protein [Paenibacillus paeoniae]|uniref:DoxX family protein n=1 Tax=Paenibacillus paeoniae TaxID=2292705 RepID=A0A371PFE6_9BACL|nr:DoxX family protein [Paenibacillus paeoniae]REK74595.1 DoxX family protein [Paenibacillus paeoniae]
MMELWRKNRWAAGLVTVIRIVLGYQWLTSGWHKITGDVAFNAGGYLGNAVTNPVLDKATGEALYPTYNAFIENFALPNVKLINVIIPWGEFLVGLGLILGTLTVTAAFFGLMMNFMFMFAGTISTNPWLTLLGVAVLVAGANAGRFGGDRWVLPWLKATVGQKRFGKFGKPDRGIDGKTPNA